MGAVMNQDKLKAVVSELAKDIKTEQALGDLTSQLFKLTVETALNKELDSYLGYEKHSLAGRNTGNSRNGSAPKILKGKHGEVTISRVLMPLAYRHSICSPNWVNMWHSVWAVFTKFVIAKQVGSDKLPPR